MIDDQWSKLINDQLSMSDYVWSVIYEDQWWSVIYDDQWQIIDANWLSINDYWWSMIINFHCLMIDDQWSIINDQTSIDNNWWLYINDWLLFNDWSTIIFNDRWPNIKWSIINDRLYSMIIINHGW